MLLYVVDVVNVGMCVGAASLSVEADRWPTGL